MIPAGGMILHSDAAYVIDASGRTRYELNMDPGPGTSSTKSSFAAVLANRRPARDEAGMSRSGRRSSQPAAAAALAARTALSARAAGVLALALSVLLAVGCGSAPDRTAAGARATLAVRPALATSTVGAAGSSWAVVEMGGSAAQSENFWQLFTCQDATASWKLATPRASPTTAASSWPAAGEPRSSPVSFPVRT